MPFIDIAYFTGPLLLQVNGNTDAINNAIARYEPKYLRAVLGNTLYDEIVAGAVASGVYFSTQFSTQFYQGGIPQRWDWIINGHTFDLNGRRYVWPGIQNAERISAAANYVYWYYLKEKNPYPTGSGGFASSKLENAEAVGPFRPAKSAWNDMVELNGILYLMLTELRDTNNDLYYPEFVSDELWYNRESYNVYNFQTFL